MAILTIYDGQSDGRKLEIIPDVDLNSIAIFYIKTYDEFTHDNEKTESEMSLSYDDCHYLRDYLNNAILAFERSYL